MNDLTGQDDTAITIQEQPCLDTCRLISFNVTLPTCPQLRKLEVRYCNVVLSSLPSLAILESDCSRVTGIIHTQHIQRLHVWNSTGLDYITAEEEDVDTQHWY